LDNLYLIAAADHLLQSKGESKESVMTGLAILGDTSLKTTGGGANDKHNTISLGGTSDHVMGYNGLHYLKVHSS
jgi:hypothetical protein